MKRKRSSKWNIAKYMPPLKHSGADDGFDIANSEAAVWLARQPDIMQIIFDSVREHGEIVFDPVTRTWQGIDYGD